MPPCPKRRIKKRPAALDEVVKGKPLFGDEGLIRLAFIGDDPEQVYGDFTGASYPFDVRSTLFVDVRDSKELVKSGDFSYAYPR